MATNETRRTEEEEAVSTLRNEIGRQSPSRLWPDGNVCVRSATLSLVLDGFEAQAAEVARWRLNAEHFQTIAKEYAEKLRRYEDACERLRARVAEYDGLARHAQAVITLRRKGPHGQTTVAYLIESEDQIISSLASLAPEGATT